MIGTIVNVIAVIVGSIIGLFFNKKLPDKVITTVFQGIGLFTLYLGFSMAGSVSSNCTRCGSR